MYIPKGFGTMFPYVFASQADKYIEFLKKAFDAVEVGRTTAPSGTVANSRMRIGTTTFMVSEASEQMKPTKGTFYLYVEDADAACKKAVSSGAEKMFDPTDMPYRDRQCGVIDPAGNIWWVSQRLVQEPYD